jgi:hypothetical protein
LLSFLLVFSSPDPSLNVMYASSCSMPSKQSLASSLHQRPLSLLLLRKSHFSSHPSAEFCVCLCCLQGINCFSYASFATFARLPACSFHRLRPLAPTPQNVLFVRMGCPSNARAKITPAFTASPPGRLHRLRFIRRARNVGHRKLANTVQRQQERALARPGIEPWTADSPAMSQLEHICDDRKRFKHSKMLYFMTPRVLVTSISSGRRLRHRPLPPHRLRPRVPRARGMRVGGRQAHARHMR